MIRFPTLHLARYVQNYVCAQVDGGLTHLPATTSPTLVVFHSGATRLEASGRPLPPAFLAGPALSPRQSFADAKTEFVSVLFRPGELHRFFNIDASELTGTEAPLRELVGSEADEVIDAVMRASNPEEMFNRLEKFLSLRLRRIEAKRRRDMVLHLSSGLINAPLALIARELGVSERTFQRQFAYQYGTSLREFKRVTQFANALAGLLRGGGRRGNLGHFAHQTGYFDHAHFDRSFRAMCGMPPSQLVQSVNDGDPSLWPFRFRAGELDRLFPR